MNFVPEPIENYCLEHSSSEGEVLAALNRETQIKTLNPRMLSGQLQGQLLSMISHMIQPRYILEIGTFTGYSAICLAQGLQKDGQLHTIESNPELEDIIVSYIKKAALTDKISLHIGHAQELIPQINRPFDLVFIDADKENYLQYFEMVWPKLVSGGFILADNVLWSGKVLSKNADDAETQALKTFNKHIANHKSLEVLMMPFRDGLSLIRKK